MKSTSWIALVLTLSATILPVRAQPLHVPAYNQHLISEEILDRKWPSHWISAPFEKKGEMLVNHFRKQFELKEVPASYVVHISADNQYKLYVNGSYVRTGPGRSDERNWFYDTVDLAPFLKSGKNVVAVLVWNFGEKRMISQHSMGHAVLVMQGNTKQESAINTNQSWKVYPDKAYSAFTDWKINGYCAIGATEKINMSKYPHGWENPDYNDEGWLTPALHERASYKGDQDYVGHWLVPSPIPAMEMKMERLQRVRQQEGINMSNDFLQGRETVRIPANTKARVLLDQNYLTTGYLTLQFSKGRQAMIDIGYAEGLVTEKNTWKKGNRDEIEGKCFQGYTDRIIADGGENRTFTTLWWRTWRYLELTIETKDEALLLNDLYGHFSAYPFERLTTFDADGRKDLQKILDMGWRTARLCAHDTYMDCPYYEQLQYFGDARIQTMVTMYNTADTCMVRQAIDKGFNSLMPEGITTSRYPSSLEQVIPPYSYSWIGIAYDYWMFRGEDDYIRRLLPSFRGVMSWFEQYLKDDGSLKLIPFWYFGDWPASFKYGVPPREKNGGSAFQDLEFLLALQMMTKMEMELGSKPMAEHYGQLAERTKSHIRKAYWNEAKGLYADTYMFSSYSQHVNIMAILSGVAEGQEAKKLCEKILMDETLTQATVYYRYYLYEAMDKAGLGDEILGNIVFHTQNMMAAGLTTMAEMPEPSRSDCHAWGCSHNIYFYKTLLGIRSAAPGFKKVLIKPSLKGIKNASGSIPHPDGTISVTYKNGKMLEASIILPDGITGDFIWKGRRYPLREGQQSLKLN